MDIRSHLRVKIEESLKKLGISGEVVLEHPTELSHGDYSTNIAMVLAQKAKSNPKALAEEIAKNIPKSEYISRVEVAGPGFINFYLVASFFSDSVKEVIEKGENFGKNSLHEGHRILVEHSSPNLFKPFLVG
ncbi:MAG: arginine--tRNA ligase, partial [Bacteroidetes bacterium]|nr:arginine--tRNA ligase [Bacteroidota bacterium]